jgi:hypothetical protein
MAVPLSTVSTPAGTVDSYEDARTNAAAGMFTLYAVVAASACIIVGLIWDISWHRTIGRDTFWSPPHLLSQAGAIISGLACGYLVLRTSFTGTAADKARSVTFWKYFHGPLGAWVCIWGALMMVTSAPFDDWWHNAYGLDVKIISPPHAVLAAGMIGIQLGAMLMAVAAQNRSASVSVRRLGVVFTFSAAFIVLMLQTVTMEHAAYANEMHSSGYYITTALTLPLALVAFGRASRLSWPATRIALVYMAMGIVFMWVLQLVPGTPKLAPIYREVTHMVPPPFPALLVFPALAIDWLMAGNREKSDWLLAAILGICFVGVMLIVHWPWAEFMLSPMSRNFIFAGDLFDYTSRQGDWQYRFWNKDEQEGAWSAALFAQRMLIAIGIATIMSRLGLACGRALARVRR